MGYTPKQGSLLNLPLVPDEIHEEIIDILRTFNEIEDEPATEYECKEDDTRSGDRPETDLISKSHGMKY